MDNPNITMEEYIRLEIWYDEDVQDLRSFETELPAIVFNDNLTSNETLFCEPTIGSLNDNEIDFRISFDESDDEDYTHIDEFDLKDETSLSEYDEEEQNILYFNDLFPFNIIYPDDLKSDKDNDDNKISIIQSSGGNLNTQGSNELLEGSHDKINKIFNMKSFIMELNMNIVAWNYFVNEMVFNLIKNLYVPFGIPFDPIRYYKDGDCTRMLRRPRLIVCSIAGRSQAPKKVVVTDLFYLRGMDVGSVNVPYLLARYLRMFASGRKQGAMISGGQFLPAGGAFGLLTEERLKGLTVIAAEDAPVANEGAPAIPAPVQAPQQPPLAARPARTMAQMLASVEE
ncbi:hypothetical protein Tco_0468132 [Tanacetum coccineum]